MSNKLAEGTVRDINQTEEDAKLLAECFNSFDDSDSWPGGFTRGTPFTTERVLDHLQKKEDIRVMVAEIDDKIVGHCNVCQSELDPEASYVGLLGVNPAYQKRGFGKAMLIEATETSADAGKRRVDLHTWGGNLKAVPLYKRVGYNWVPDTRVLMESHIPGILNTELFSKFFDRHNWYESLRREIKQEPDDFEEDGIGIFEYCFESDGDILQVLIDREAKGICGFSQTVDGQTIEAKIRPKRHIGYIGYGTIPFSITLKNKTKKELRYTIGISPSDHLQVEFEHDDAGLLRAGESIELSGLLSIDKNVEPLDREKDPDIKVKTQAEFKLEIGDEKVSLFTGLIPTELVRIDTNPQFPSLSPNEKREIGLVLTNNAESSLRGILEATSRSGSIPEMNKPFFLDAGNSVEIPLEVAADDSVSNKIGMLDLAVYINEKNRKALANKKVISFPILEPTGAVAYKSNNGYFILETHSLRIGIHDRPPMALRKIWHKQSNRSFSVWGCLPILGYPFPSGGTEWDHKRFETKILNTPNYAELQLTGESTEKPGCKVTISQKLIPGCDCLETSIKMSNDGSEVLENLGVKFGGWAEIRGQKMHVPLRGRIYHLSSPEWDGNGQLPRKPKEYHENWAAVSLHDGEVLLGYMWSEEDDLSEIKLRRRGIPEFEFGLPDLSPGESISKMLLRFHIGDGNWSKIRNLSAAFNGKRLPDSAYETTFSDLQAGFRSPGFVKRIHSGAPLLLKNDDITKSEFEVRIINKNPISVKGRIKLPDGVTFDGKSVFEFQSKELSIDSPYRTQLKLRTTSDGAWVRKDGEIELKFQNRLARIPFTAIIHDSAVETETETRMIKGKKLETLGTERVNIAVSPDYNGGLVRISEKVGHSILYDTFPEAESFVWWDSFHSGVSPIIASDGTWDWQTAVAKESWNLSTIELAPWIGYQMNSQLKHCPGLKGFTWRLRYLLLPGTPLVHLSVKAENNSNRWERFTFGFRIALPLGDSLANAWTVVNGRERYIEPTGQSLTIEPSPEEGWICTDYEPNRIGIISTAKHRTALSFSTLSDKAQIINLSDERELYPGESTDLQGYIVLSRNCDQIQMLKDLPSLIFK